MTNEPKEWTPDDLFANGEAGFWQDDNGTLRVFGDIDISSLQMTGGIKSVVYVNRRMTEYEIKRTEKAMMKLWQVDETESLSADKAPSAAQSAP